MATLNTVFKKVFGEGLKEYGFVKIKGRQPYLVRVVGDEIIHVITYGAEWCEELEYKAFCILGGVATVYRNSINLTRSCNYNMNWLNDLSEFYVKPNPINFDTKYRVRLMSFNYLPDDDESKHSAMKYAMEETKKVMLPVFNKVTSLNSAIKYFDMFHSALIFPPEYQKDRDGFCCGEFDEGLLYIKTNNHDDFIEEYQKKLAKEMEAIEKGESLWSSDKIRGILEEGRLEKVLKRDEIYNNPEIYAKALVELEQRKATNIESLRSYGLEV